MSSRLLLTVMLAIPCVQLAYGQHVTTSLEARRMDVYYFLYFILFMFACIVVTADVYRTVRSGLDPWQKQRLMHTSRYKQEHDDYQVLLRGWAAVLGLGSLRWYVPTCFSESVLVVVGIFIQYFEMVW